MTGRDAAAAPHGAGDDALDLTIARVLTIGTWAAVALLAAGVAILLGRGRSPLDAASPLDPGTLVADLAALRPEGFLWPGLVAVIATPAARVATSLVGYLRNGERPMALVAASILAVIALSVVLAVGAEG